MNLSDQELAILKDGVLAVVRHRPVEAWIIGSFARGEEVRSSDLDLMVKASRALNIDEMAGMRGVFDASDLPYIIDLVDYHQVSPQRLGGMMQGAKLLLKA